MSLWLPRPSPAGLARSYSRVCLSAPRRFPVAAHYQLVRLPPPAAFSTTRSWREEKKDGSSDVPAKPDVSKQGPPAPKEAPPQPPAPLMKRVWKKVKHEAEHYWNGSKLLVSEVRISARLQWKILHGETLTRRERRQVCCADLLEGILLINIAVEAYDAGSAAAGALRRLCGRPLHGTATSCRTQALPQHAPLHLRGQVCRAREGA